MATIELPKMNVQAARIKIVGDSPLICHSWDDRVKEAMLGKQTGRARTAKAPREPFREYLRSLYWLTPMPANIDESNAKKLLGAAEFGFPAGAFKDAAVDACSHIDGVTKVEARGAFHVSGRYAKLQGSPAMREDMVRVGMGAADLRYRGEFQQWSCEIPIRYNANVLSLEQIVNLFNTAGFAIGVGDWRPARNGSYGMFHVALEGE